MNGQNPTGAYGQSLPAVSGQGPADVYGQPPTGASVPSSRSPIAVKLDNLIRSKLRVSNPYDPFEVADGLTRFYRGAAEHKRLEEAGLPFYQVQVVQPPRLAPHLPLGGADRIDERSRLLGAERAEAQALSEALPAVARSLFTECALGDGAKIVDRPAAA